MPDNQPQRAAGFIPAVRLVPSDYSVSHGGSESRRLLCHLKLDYCLLLAFCLLSPQSTLVGQENQDPPFLRAMAYSPDGLWLATGSGDLEGPGELVVWNLKAQRPQFVRQENQGIPGVAFSRDSRRLAFGVFNSEECKLLDPVTGEVKTILAGHGEAARGVTFSPDGRLLAVCSYDKSIHLWDLGTEKAVAKLEGHGDIVYQAAFSHDGKRLASVSRDKTVRLWDVPGAKLLKTFDDYQNITRQVAFGSDSKWIVAASWDWTVKLRDADSGKVFENFARPGSAEGLALSKDGSLVAVARGSAVEVHPVILRPANAEEKKRIGELLEELDDEDINFRDQAGKDLLKIGRLVEPFLREAMKTGKSVEVKMRCRRLRSALRDQPPDIMLRGHDGDVQCVQFSRDGQTLASAGRDGVVILWDTKTWKKTGELRR